MRALACLLILSQAALARAPVAARAAGPAQSGAVAQDTKLGRVYVAQPVDDTVLVLRAGDMGLLAVIAVPPSPASLAVDPTRGRLYVASDRAGAISVFDARTYRLLDRRLIGGHPAGLAVSARGRALIVTDEASGAVLRMPALPALGAPDQVLSLGPAGRDTMLLAPASAGPGHQSLVWARGFQPGEPVDVYWGIHRLKGVVADGAGFAITTITVPTKTDLGLHLLIAMGRWSAHSVSTVLDVTPNPKPPKHRIAPVKPQSPLASVARRLLRPRVTLALPTVPALGPLAALRRFHPHPAVPALPFEALLLLACSALILRAGRRRRKRAPRPGKGKRARGGRPRAPAGNLRRAT